MADNSEIQNIVERAVAQVLEGHLPQLQAELTRRVLEVLPPRETVERRTGASKTDADGLLRAVLDIHAGGTQKEILRALLSGGSAYCSRIALFVVRAGAAAGWQSRGFSNDDEIKDFSLDVNAGPVVHALNERAAAPANVAEMDPKFVEQFGAPANEQILVLPLVLKDKVAALVYADGGEHSEMDSAALELLVAATSSWLEVASLRKQAQKENAPEAGAQEREPAPVPVQAVSSFPDPFAGTSPSHVAASIPAAPEPAPVPAAPNERVEDDRVEEVVEVASLTQSAAAGAASAPAAATDPFAGISPEDADTHRKAQRFARLLVDEIKLYNQAKVAEGRRHKDVYDRLKDDIDKSHSTYQKRYGKTAAASGEYFQQELVRSLAEDDATLMGANFRK